VTAIPNAVIGALPNTQPFDTKEQRLLRTSAHFFRADLEHSVMPQLAVHYIVFSEKMDVSNA